MTPRARLLAAAPRYSPWVGAAIGALGGGVYWLAAQLWPPSIAVALAMLVMEVLAQSAPTGAFALVFALLIKYNALLGLSSASLPFALPDNLSLGLIMIAGLAASRAMVMSLRRASYAELGIAWATGFAPGALLGVPGLCGLVAAVLARIGHGALIRRRRTPAADTDLALAGQLCEIGFYLGALGARAFV